MRINDSIFLGAIVPELDNGTLVIQQNKRILFLSLLSRLIDVVVRGVSPLSLLDAIAGSLEYLKAFGGTEQRNLPDGYIQRQFIYMMDGSYLLTDIVPTYDGRYELDMQTTNIAGSPTTYLGCVQSTGTSQGLRFAHITNGAVRVVGFGSYSDSAGGTIAANTRYKFVWNNNVCSVTTGETTVLSNTFSDNQTVEFPLAINAYNIAGTISGNLEGIYLYGFKAWNAQGELVANYVPAVQKGTVPVVGFYDTVSGTFKTATAGTFAAGGEAVPTPDTPMDIVSNNGVLKVRHQSGLPLGYTAVEYLQNGSTSCAISTGVYPTNTSRVEMKWSVSDAGSVYIFGSRPGGGTQVFTLSGSQSGGTVTGYANGTYKAANTDGVNWSRTEGIDNIFDSYLALNNGEVEYAVDDLVNDRHYSETFSYSPFVGDIDTPIHLFGNGSNSQPGGAKIWFCKIYDGETLLMDLVPVIRNSDNVSGFYDKVGGGFYTTEQGGTYIGIPITDPVEIYTDGTVETIEDTIGNTATAEMLLKVGDYQDVQEILSGAITRNVGVKVLDGTEDWQLGADTSRFTLADGFNNLAQLTDAYVGYSNCYTIIATSVSIQSRLKNNQCGWNTTQVFCLRDDRFTTVAGFQQFLSDQYAAGTPVIVVYPLATPTTETVAGQAMQVQQGDNIVEITQASMSGLELEAKYQAAVTLTIQEVQDANLDPNVEVTIN